MNREKARLLVFFILNFQLLTFNPFALAATRLLTPGQAAAPFLKVPLSARAAALGESFVAWGRDAAAVEYNPAGVAAVDGVHVSATHVLSFQDSALSGFSAAGSYGRLGGGVHYRQFTAEDDARDATGRRDGDIGHQDKVVQLAVAARLGRLGFGLGGKLIGRRIERTGGSVSTDNFDVDSEDFAWDAGLLWALPRLGALGLSAQNLGGGSALSYSGDATASPFGASTRGAREALPQVLRLGGAHPVGRVTFAWETDQPRDNRPSAAAGVEIRVKPWFALRTGLRAQRFLDVSVGLGVEKGFLSFDYAFAPRVDIGNVHRATVGVRF